MSFEPSCQHSQLLFENKVTAQCKWKVTSHLRGQGGYGKVHKTCCSLDDKETCHYVSKRVKFPNDDDPDIMATDKIKFESELNLLLTCAKLGLCPEVQLAWSCPNAGFIIMEEEEETLTKLLRQVAQKKNIIGILLIIMEAFNLINQLHRHHIIHNDIHLDNIMVTEVKQANDLFVRYLGKKYKYYLIDMGKASIGNITEKDKAKERLQLANAFRQNLERFPQVKNSQDIEIVLETFTKSSMSKEEMLEIIVLE